MSDKTETPDADNPPFDFSKARARRQGEPASSETARLRRALREIEKAEDLDAAHDLARRALRAS